MMLIALVWKFQPDQIGNLVMSEFDFWANGAREYCARLSTANSI